MRFTVLAWWSLAACDEPATEAPPAPAADVGPVRSPEQQKRLNYQLEQVLGSGRDGDEKVVELLAAGADPNAEGGESTPLILAEMHRYEPTVKLLLDAGAAVDQVDHVGRTALMMAAGDHSPQKIRQLLAHGARIDATGPKELTATLWACKAADPAALETLIAAGGDLKGRTTDGTTCAHFAAEANPEFVGWVVAHGAPLDEVSTEGGEPRRPIASAARSGRVEAMAALVDAGVSLTGAGEPPLAAACDGSSVGAVRWLLAHGASANERGEDGRTALMHFAEQGVDGSGGPEVLDALLAAHANLNLHDDVGRTALHYLLARPERGSPQRKSALDRLTAAGADLGAQDENGQTPAMLADLTKPRSPIAR